MLTTQPIRFCIILYVLVRIGRTSLELIVDMVEMILSKTFRDVEMLFYCRNTLLFQLLFKSGGSILLFNDE